jgi:hypothetical protein
MAALMERLLDAERVRNDRLLDQHASTLTQIGMRLTSIEARLAEALTPAQWVKVLAGIGFPIAALWLTGSVDLARQLLPSP